MFKKIAETLVSVAISGVALFVVGKLAYEAGVSVTTEQANYMALKAECARLENKCQQMREEAKANGVDIEKETDEIKNELVAAQTEQPKPAKKIGKLGFLGAIKGFMGKKSEPSPIKKMIESPQDFKIEAYMQGDEVHLSAKPKEAMA